jgi:hypothetical protein
MAGKYSKKRKHGALRFSSFFFHDAPPKKRSSKLIKIHARTV